MAEDTVSRAQDLLRVASAASKAAKAKGDLRMATLRARESGETYRDIGEAAHLSHPRIV